MIALLFALFVISLVAAAVLVAFALPNLRGGARVLTPKGERLARRTAARFRPVTDAVWPRVRPGVLAVSRTARRVGRPVTAPVARRLRPVTDAFLQASFDGVGPTVRPAVPAQERPARADRPLADEVLVLDLRDGVTPQASAGAAPRS